MTRLVLGLILSWIVVIFAVIFQIAMFAANGCWVGLAWLLFQLAIVVPPVVICRNARRRARQAEIAARARYEHFMLLSGDVATGTYGRYQPDRPAPNPQTIPGYH